VQIAATETRVEPSITISTIISVEPSVTTLRVAGELDCAAWPAAADVLRSCSNRGTAAGAVVVDFRAVTFVSASVGYELYHAVRQIQTTTPCLRVMASPVLLRLIGLLTTIDALPVDAVALMGASTASNDPAVPARRP
jgi:anti-anti-sigma regulatory factor